MHLDASRCLLTRYQGQSASLLDLQLLLRFDTVFVAFILQAGDGTNFVLIFAGALLAGAEKLLRMVNMTKYFFKIFLR